MNYGHRVNKQRYTVDIKLLLADYITLASCLEMKAQNLLYAKMAHAHLVFYVVITKRGLVHWDQTYLSLNECMTSWTYIALCTFI